MVSATILLNSRKQVQGITNTKKFIDNICLSLTVN